MIDLRKGDCLEVMKQIETGSVDAIITDPPYGTTACKWDSVIDFDLMWEQLNRIIKPNGAIVLFGSEPFSSALRMSNIKNYKYDWKWLKPYYSNFFQAKFRPLQNFENISIFGDFGCNNGSKKIGVYNPQGVKPLNKLKKNGKNASGKIGKEHKSSIKEGNIFLQEKTGYPNVVLKFNRDRNTKHPTQKPVELMEYLIKTYTNEEETVLDFTMGSGSTGVACQNTSRNFIGIEQDEKYFKIAQDRIKENEYKLF